jgi:hypothetical protein
VALRHAALARARQHRDAGVLRSCMLAWKLRLYQSRHSRCLMQLQAFGALGRAGRRAQLRECLRRLRLWAMGCRWGRARLARKALGALRAAQQVASSSTAAARQLWAHKVHTR